MWWILLLASCAGKAEPATSGDTSSAAGDTSAAPDDTGAPLPACERPELVVEIGTGADSFVPLEEGAEVTMVYGSQGGWHMLGSVEIGQTTPIVKIHYTVATVDGGVLVSDNIYQVQLVSDGECSGYYPGMYGYLDVGELVEGTADTPPELLAGDRLLMRMEVEDREGRVGADEVEVIAALDVADGGVAAEGAP